jgi:membrane associated rhomboid family serine protease
MSDFRPGGFQQLPVVVKNIIIINALVFFVQYLFEMRGISLDDTFALHYWASPKFRWWQMITHMFMHGNLGHIFLNMFALWMFGRILENIWGPQRFIVFYLVCGLGAALCHMSVLAFQFSRFNDAFVHFQENPTLGGYAIMLKQAHLNDGVFARILSFWNGNPECADCAQTAIKLVHEKYMLMANEATVGASGAVMGVLFAYGYLFPNSILYLYFAIPVKAKWFVAGYAVIELYSGIRNSAGDNIAHFAHLGGMLFAFILLRIWKSKVRDSFY